MKWILCVLFPLVSHCQADSYYNMLGKYVYQVAGVVNNYAKKQKLAEGGTCFFIKKDSAVFMVTAKHVLTGCEDAPKRKKYYPGKMYLLLKGSEDTSTIRIKIDIAAIRDTAQCLPYTDDPDVMVLKMPASLVNKINTIDTFLQEELDAINTAVIMGFNHIAVDRKNIYYTAPVAIVLNPHSYTINEPTYKNRKKDLINYLILSNEATAIGTLQGMSGAPFFFKNSKTGRFGVLGVFIRSGTYTEGNRRQNSFTIVKNDYYIDKIYTAQ